jgi:hypothetical protein
MIKLSSLIFLSFFAVACATTHNGRPIAASNTPTVALSTGAVYELSDKYYTFVEYTVENKSSEWLDMKVDGVLVNGVETELLTGDKLKSWIEGADLKLRKSQYNTSLLLASFAVAGAATAATSGSNNWRNAGVATAGVALGASAVNDINRAKKQASSNISTKDIRTSNVEVPESNILIPFKVAPESYVKRWLVIRYSIDNSGKLVTGISVNGHKTDAFVSQF